MDYFVVRNLPYGLEFEKFKEVISSAFSKDTVIITDYIQGVKGNKDITPSRCYVKIRNKVGSKSTDAFLNFMDMKPFINNKGIEEIALVEKVYFTDETMDPPNANSKSNTLEASKTYQTFLEKLNSPLPLPPSLDSLTDNLEKKKEEVSLILDELLNIPKKTRKSRSNRNKKDQTNKNKEKEKKDEKEKPLENTNNSGGGSKNSSRNKKSSKKQQQQQQQPQTVPTTILNKN